MRMEQTTHAPGQLRRILPGVLLAAGLVWLMTGSLRRSPWGCSLLP